MATRVPVFAAEWGGQEEDQEWGRSLADYFDQLGMGWTAWSWSNEPFLVAGYVPTQFGEVVRTRLAGAVNGKILAG